MEREKGTHTSQIQYAVEQGMQHAKKGREKRQRKNSHVVLNCEEPTLSTSCRTGMIT